MDAGAERWGLCEELLWWRVPAGYDGGQRMECVKVRVAARCGSSSSACDVTAAAQMVRRVRKHRPCQIGTYQALECSPTALTSGLDAVGARWVDAELREGGSRGWMKRVQRAEGRGQRGSGCLVGRGRCSSVDMLLRGLIGCGRFYRYQLGQRRPVDSATGRCCSRAGIIRPERAISTNKVGQRQMLPGCLTG